MPTFKIPYEPLDPLTIGSADDESKVYRDELELEIADANLLAAIYPEEPDHLPHATPPAADATSLEEIPPGAPAPRPEPPAAAAEALGSRFSAPPFSELIAGGKSVAIVI